MLSNFFEKIPNYYRTRETINKNELIADEIIKNLSDNKEKIQVVQETDIDSKKKNEIIYDVLTTYINIKDKCVNAIIDTGASFSVISKKLADELNLTICHSEKSNLTMANNYVIPSCEKCFNIPINIAANTYYCEAVVLDDPAHELLLGTNWLGKFRVTIDLNNKTMKIPREHEYDILILNCLKIQNLNLKAYKEPLKQIQYKTIKIEQLEPFETKRIDVKLIKREDRELQENSILYIKGTVNKNIIIPHGILDQNESIGSIFIHNNTPLIQKIAKNYTVTRCEVIKNYEIENYDDLNNKLDKEKMVNNYKGPLELLNEFQNMIDEINEEKLVKKKLEITHQIKLENNRKNINFKPYRISPVEKDQIDKKISDMLK